MKKLLTLAALIGTASLSFGQGYIGFNNGNTTKISTNGVVMAAAPVGSWYYELLVAPSTQNTANPSLAGWTAVAPGTNSSLGGRMLGNVTADGGAVPVTGFSGTSTADFVVVGWSSNLGADFATVQQWWNAGNVSAGTGQDAGMSGWFGISAVGNDLALQPLNAIYTVVWGSALNGQIPGMNLTFQAVPEPTTLALAGLGAAAMLIFRRRK